MEWHCKYVSITICSYLPLEQKKFLAGLCECFHVAREHRPDDHNLNLYDALPRPQNELSGKAEENWPATRSRGQKLLHFWAPDAEGVRIEQNYKFTSWWRLKGFPDRCHVTAVQRQNATSAGSVLRLNDPLTGRKDSQNNCSDDQASDFVSK